MATVNENDLCLWWAGKVSTYGNTTLVQTHTVLVNSKVFLTYDVGWKCLFMYLVWHIQKVTHSIKNLLLGKNPKISLKVEIFGVICYFWVYMMHQSCHYDSATTACFGKISFSSYNWKCSWPIRLQDFLSFNITKTIWVKNFSFCI